MNEERFAMLGRLTLALTKFPMKKLRLIFKFFDKLKKDRGVMSEEIDLYLSGNANVTRIMPFYVEGEVTINPEDQNLVVLDFFNEDNKEFKFRISESFTEYFEGVIDDSPGAQTLVSLHRDTDSLDCQILCALGYNDGIVTMSEVKELLIEQSKGGKFLRTFEGARNIFCVKKRRDKEKYYQPVVCLELENQCWVVKLYFLDGSAWWSHLECYYIGRKTVGSQELQA